MPKKHRSKTFLILQFSTLKRTIVPAISLLLLRSLPDIQKVKVLVTQSCLTLCDPMDYSPPGSSVHGMLQARILAWNHALLRTGAMFYLAFNNMIY